MLNGTTAWTPPMMGSNFLNGNCFAGAGVQNPYQSLAQILMMFAMFEAMQGQQQGGQFPGMGNNWSDPCGCNSAMNYDPSCAPSACLPDLSCWGGQQAQDDCECHAHGSGSGSFAAAFAFSINGDNCPPPAPEQNSSASAAAAVAVQQEQPAPQPSGGDGGGGDGGGAGGAGGDGGGGGTPVLLDVNGDGKIDTTGKGGHKVQFDLDADGKKDTMEWMKAGSQDGMLVADYNNDGQINDGRELMRRTGENGEKDKYKNGWDKVSQLYDKNHDGVVKGDELNGLKMWVDSNGDAKTDPGELRTLAQMGISQIDLPKNQGEMDSTFVRNGKTQLARDYDFEMANGGRVA